MSHNPVNLAPKMKTKTTFFFVWNCMQFSALHNNLSIFLCSFQLVESACLCWWSHNKKIFKYIYSRGLQNASSFKAQALFYQTKFNSALGEIYIYYIAYAKLKLYDFSFKSLYNMHYSYNQCFFCKKLLISRKTLQFFSF